MKKTAIAATLTVSALAGCQAADQTTVLPDTSAVALRAGMPDASAPMAPVGGSVPGSFLVPGTDTSIKIGGFVKVSSPLRRGGRTPPTRNGSIFMSSPSPRDGRGPRQRRCPGQEHRCHP